MALISTLLMSAAPAWASQTPETVESTVSATAEPDDAEVNESADSELEASEEQAEGEAAPETETSELDASDPEAQDDAVSEEDTGDEPASEKDAAEEPSEDKASEDAASTEQSRDGPAEKNGAQDSADDTKDAEPSADLRAASTPVYEITGQWIDPPATITRGTPVVAEWRVNVNDDEEPPSNDPVDNVVATFTVDKAFFDEIPDLCLTDGVDPASSISDDGMELTCNFGTVDMGTALVVQTPVVANGNTGEEIVLDGTSPGDETVELDPIEIVNPFLMDIQWNGVTNYEQWDDIFDPTYVDVDLEWSVRLGKGSDPGPTDAITYRLNVAATDVNNQPQRVEVGFHPSDRGQPDNHGKEGCTSYDFGAGNGAEGHPFSSVPENDRHTNFVEKCKLSPVDGQPGVFDLTLEGINYDLADVPELDSQGNLLPPNWDYVASGTVWFRVHTSEAGSIRLTSEAPTYEAPTGQEYDDLPGNNRTNKAYTLPGGWAAAWVRAYTGSGGTHWDDSYRVPAGTTLTAVANNTGGAINADPDSQWGNCVVLDTAYVTYQDFVPDPDRDRFASQVRGYPAAGQENPGGPYTLDNPPAIQYYTGGVGDPDTFDCGVGGWSTDAPADPADVTAIRIVYDHSLYADEDWAGFQLQARVKINDDVPAGQDVWTFGSALRNGNWVGPGRGGVITPTPGSRYEHTNGRRDIVRIVLADPHIEKEAAEATVTPGVPADFTLTYSATGSGLIPDTVDGYEIVDTLPVGMTYEPESADPEPVVTTDAQGRQVLTWTLDGVETNVDHELTYQAVADSSIEPGTTLTNTAYSSLAGEDSAEVDETVTTTANGYTMILKTSDVEYIPNIDGDGVGQGSWTVEIESNDPISQSFTDTIDILPYNGDGRGTSYSGTYTLDEVVTPEGGTVYYTDADPETLSDDPDDESNGTRGDPDGNTVGWTTDRPDNPTAIRVIGGELESGDTFSFQVVITTEGAQAQDVFVNRAQARAEHTELVMRTSAVLIVTDYSVEKTSDPEPGSTVAPGDVVTYMVEVTQEGDVPAGAVFRDDLADVLDDAVYNDDVDADIGEATVEDGVLSWEGEIPVGEVATITYSVTVKDIEGLEADGDTIIDNSVWSPGCPASVEGEENPCEPPPIIVGWYDYSKTSDPAPGSTVQTGDVVTYNVEIVQRGEGAIENARIEDDLSAVLDDAEWNDDAEASQGEVSYDEPNLTWTGDLE
ncbi:hypothetical protein, partial [Phytoactinopolyspora endophytica]|uniref:DUF7927 domain-containing protein n=1 Tax=Phytoactinopolyspora endophytica TaxID=1642495 RepID=UPI0013EAA7B3